jgi:hypothetical protein
MNTQEAAVEKKALKVFAGGLRAWGREVLDGKGAASKAKVFKNV